MLTDKPISVFQYLPDLDAFTVTKEYLGIAEKLGLTEWNPVVWIGRYFTLDNDFGEHWFDNFEEREALREKARQYGVDADDLYIINPQRFQDGRDGPCHSAELRKQFWTEVLSSFRLRLSTLFAEARYTNELTREREATLPSDVEREYITDLEGRIEEIRREYEAR